MAERPPNTIRTKVMCLFVRDGKVLTGKGYEKARKQTFYRVLGGSLDFGESAEQGIRREIREELKCGIEKLKLIDVFENLYTYEGKQGHDVIFLYKGDLENKELYDKDIIHIKEDGYEFDAEWVPVKEIISGKKILYPEWNYRKALKRKERPLSPRSSGKELLDAIELVTSGETGIYNVDVVKDLNTFLSVRYQRITAWTAIAAILASLAIAFYIPIHQTELLVKSEITSLYKSIIANGDVAQLENLNRMHEFKASDNLSVLPRRYISHNLTENTRRELQDVMGLTNYSVLLYYLEQTDLLNQSRDRVVDAATEFGPNSREFINAKTTYLRLIEESAGEGLGTQFSYFLDTGCLAYIMHRSFPYLELGERLEGLNCRNDSLNRFFYWFGYLEAETPEWMKSRFRDALNEREAGLGNRIIQN